MPYRVALIHVKGLDGLVPLRELDVAVEVAGASDLNDGRADLSREEGGRRRKGHCKADAEESDGHA